MPRETPALSAYDQFVAMVFAQLTYRERFYIKMITPPDVEAELGRSDRGKRTANQNILLLLFSLAGFYATGLLNASWTSVTILVSVLSIHEAGHWVGMKCFGYRDMKMFFIPYLGAAVSGRETKVSGERRAIVSLLGPAPGIFIGIVCAFVYLKWRQPILFQFAFVSVLLNGFNLLPIYPLDGGQFMQTVVFSRHPTVDTAFKILAAITLTVFAIRFSSIRMGILAIFTLLLAREGYFQGKIAQRLRVIINGQPIPETDRMPMEYLEAILPDLSAGVPPKRVKVKLLANRAETVWNLISQQAPKVGASIALLGVYTGIFVFGIAASIVFLATDKALSQKAVIAHQIAPDGSSVTVEEIYRNQHKISTTQLNDKGLYDGPSTTWTTKGVKRQEGMWRNGYLQGAWQNYNADGTIKSIVTYENGRPIKYDALQDGSMVELPFDQWPLPVKLTVQNLPKGTRLKLPSN